MSGGDGGAGIENLPTWLLTATCMAMAGAAVSTEWVLERIAKFLEGLRDRALLDVIHRLKSELMVLGFNWLFLNFVGPYMTKFCISKEYLKSWLPCPEQYYKVDPTASTHQLLAENNVCNKQDMAPIITIEVIHQVHVFLFNIALIHVIVSIITYYICKAKMLKWDKWEKETRFTQTPFIRPHKKRSPRYIVSFFKQFLAVKKTEYLCLRQEFVRAHSYVGALVDFPSYIERSLQRDFRTFVHINAVLWGSVGLVLLCNVGEWYWIQWLPIISRCIITTAIGTVLQAIVENITPEIQEGHDVNYCDKHFLLRHPQIALNMISMVSVQNALQIAHILWIWYLYGMKSCFHDNYVQILTKVVLSAVLQLICSYSTLPLYALVSQFSSAAMQRDINAEMQSAKLRTPPSSPAPETSQETIVLIQDDEEMQFEHTLRAPPSSPAPEAFQGILIQDDEAFSDSEDLDEVFSCCSDDLDEV